MDLVERTVRQIEAQLDPAHRLLLAWLLAELERGAAAGEDRPVPTHQAADEPLKEEKPASPAGASKHGIREPVRKSYKFDRRVSGRYACVEDRLWIGLGCAR